MGSLGAGLPRMRASSAAQACGLPDIAHDITPHVAHPSLHDIADDVYIRMKAYL